MIIALCCISMNRTCPLPKQLGKESDTARGLVRGLGGKAESLRLLTRLITV